MNVPVLIIGASLALAASLVAGADDGSTKKDDEWVLKWTEFERDSEKENNKQASKVIAIERNLSTKLAEIDDLKEQLSEKDKNDAVVDGVKSGDIRVRKEFACPKPKLSGTSAAAEQRDDQSRADIQQAIAAAVIRIGGQCDEVARRLDKCQATVTAYWEATQLGRSPAP